MLGCKASAPSRPGSRGSLPKRVIMSVGYVVAVPSRLTPLRLAACMDGWNANDRRLRSKIPRWCWRVAGVPCTYTSGGAPVQKAKAEPEGITATKSSMLCWGISFRGLPCFCARKTVIKGSLKSSG